LLLAPLCARFRDLQQILQNVVALSMFLTPVMWRSEQLQGKFDALTLYNPFGTFLELIRGPLLGHVPAAHYYWSALVVTFAGFAIAIPFYAKFRRRIVYWL
jgi:lipopolysaccharide transport system permease protein